MTRRLTAIVEREGDGYVALCPEVDVASQGETVVEARDNLAVALAMFFETAPADEVDRRLRGEVYVTDLTPQNGSRGNLTIWVEKGRSECRRRGTAQSRSYGSYGRLRWSWPEARRSRMPAAS